MCCLNIASYEVPGFLPFFCDEEQQSIIDFELIVISQWKARIFEIVFNEQKWFENEMSVANSYLQNRY